MPRTLTLDVGPAAPAEAAALYAAAFDLEPPVPTAEGVRLAFGRMAFLVRPDTAVATEWYVPGRTPRIELRVDDVDALMADLLSFGFTERCRLGDPGAASHYAQLLDPFGHLWALALVDPPS